MMTHENRKCQLKIISRLLDYPDELLRGLIPVFRTMLDERCTIAARDGYETMFRYVESTALIDLQMKYTETFDLKPANSLNLTYHRYGDSEERGRALAGLEEIYSSTHLERTKNELPDYLPLMLEFISEHPVDGRTGILPQCRDSLRILADRFIHTDDPYACLFRQVIILLDMDKKTNHENTETTGCTAVSWHDPK